jgi:hypothetical protein
MSARAERAQKLYAHVVPPQLRSDAVPRQQDGVGGVPESGRCVEAICVEGLEWRARPRAVLAWLFSEDERVLAIDLQRAALDVAPRR